MSENASSLLHEYYESNRIAHECGTAALLLEQERSLAKHSSTCIHQALVDRLDAEQYLRLLTRFDYEFYGKPNKDGTYGIVFLRRDKYSRHDEKNFGIATLPNQDHAARFCKLFADSHRPFKLDVNRAYDIAHVLGRTIAAVGIAAYLAIWLPYQYATNNTTTADKERALKLFTFIFSPLTLLAIGLPVAAAYNHVFGQGRVNRAVQRWNRSPYKTMVTFLSLDANQQRRELE
ncbi:hypothetical protein HY642_01330 [Candidatus Woesearchaeota archaeon]|nr:hypothetical protein [Candidatus Woesearchaeota archaeon]